jgi:hypothetical protein
VPELEQRLAELATVVDWPGTPQLAGLVSARLSSAAARPRRLPAYGGGRRWATAAAVVVLAGAALIAYAPSRDAIAGWLNLHAIIELVQHPPSPSPQPSGPLGKRFGLGSETTLARSQGALAWSIAVPSMLGSPDEVYLQQPPNGPPEGEVTLVYTARSGIPVASQTGVAVLITEARGAVDTNFFGKMLGPTATLEEVTVAGHKGYWIAGQPNVFFFVDADGNLRNETMRMAANTLILDDNGTIVRIEGNLTKAQALQIAASL